MGPARAEFHHRASGGNRGDASGFAGDQRLEMKNAEETGFDKLGFGDGRITFAVRCQGNPFPVDQILHPIFTLRRGNGGYRLVAESVLVSVPGFGRVDLKDFFAPVDIQSLLTQGLNLSGRPTMLEVKVEKIVLSRDIIDIAARLQLTPLTNR